jgi:hypothetical protein
VPSEKSVCHGCSPQQEKPRHHRFGDDSGWNRDSWRSFGTGLGELPDLWRQILIGLFIAGGAYMMYRFFRNAEKVEPVFEK